MKKLIISTVLIVLVLLCITFIIIPLMNTASAQKEGVSSIIISQISHSYTIKDYDGNIAVYQYGSPTPFRVTDVKIDSLPQADQELLQNGIKAENDDELKTLLEDYCS